MLQNQTKMNRLFNRISLTAVSRRFYAQDYQAMVEANKIVVFMKGTPDAPQVSLLFLELGLDLMSYN